MEKDALLNTVSDECQEIDPDTLQMAVTIWRIWHSQLCRDNSSNEEEGNGWSAVDMGQLLPTPMVSIQKDDNDHVASTNDNPSTTDNQQVFQVNTIYTRPEVAKMVVKTFVRLVKEQPNEPDSSEGSILWLDAGAGGGALLEHLPCATSIGIDLNPQAPNVHYQDFLQVSPEWLQVKHSSSSINGGYTKLCIISNPPFAENSRGDYSIIGKFLQHAIQINACCIGLIVPVNFCKVWRSLVDDKLLSKRQIRLRYRMMLPKHSFIDPSSGTTKNIQCHFLFFEIEPLDDLTATIPSTMKATREEDGARRAASSASIPCAIPRIHVVSKRNKGRYATISTADLTSAVVKGLQAITAKSKFELGTSQDSSVTLTAKLDDKLELFVELNPKRPLSIWNSNSKQFLRGKHSLGYMPTSVKPSLARAMNRLAFEANANSRFSGQYGAKSQNQGKPGHSSLAGAVVVNIMAGEGTLEFESSSFCISKDTDEGAYDTSAKPRSFRIVGDQNMDVLQRVQKTSGRVHLPLVDFVAWDAQRLPFRDGVVDSILGDLPFSGSVKKVHQVPSAAGDKSNPKQKGAVSATSPSLSYQHVIAEMVRVLQPKSGRSVLVSPDPKALAFAVRKYSGSLKEEWQTKVNIGGIAGKFLCLVRKDACWKDQNFWVFSGTTDLSSHLLVLAQNACSLYSLNGVLELVKKDTEREDIHHTAMMRSVHLHDVFEREGRISHSYRFCFDPLVNNFQAKTLEKEIRSALHDNPISGAEMRLPPSSSIKR